MEAATRNPLATGLDKAILPQPCVLVILGAAGDLTRRKLLPAVYNLALDGFLPPGFAVMGFARGDLNDAAFRDVARKGIEKYSRRPIEERAWPDFESSLFYTRGSFDDDGAYHELRRRIEEVEASRGIRGNRIFYLSVPPSAIENCVTRLHAAGLVENREAGVARVIVEKPIGRDLDSARQINDAVSKVFEERQIFRIDHYLGKETVQDLLVQRFANAIFEPLWNRNFIDSVQITVAEEVGVGSRGGYYEQSGCLRDMIQNHTMQLLALTAMEPPGSLDPEAIRDEKVKVLKAIQPLTIGPAGDVARAQYSAGMLAGKPAKGYLEEEGIAPQSGTETYAALRLSINNWRWQGVPFYLRSGKRMARRVSEIAINFRRPPNTLFAGETARFDLAANTLSFQIQPDEGLSLILNTKVPGLETRTQPVKMSFRYATTFGSNTAEAYERLVLDAMIGDGTLFIRGDEAEASWKLYTPVLDYWRSVGREGMDAYPAGSWGPPSAEALLAKQNHCWRQP